jgi:hypothetical protein
MHKGTSHKTKKRNQHKKYRNEFVHHIATLIRPRLVLLDWSIMLPSFFSAIGRHYQTIPIDEQGLDVDYIKRHFVKGNSAVFIFVPIVITQQPFH